MRRRPSLACLIAGALLAPAAAHAQFVHGVVLYNHNDLPVAVATVRIVDEGGRVLAATLSDTEGRFALPLPSAQEFWVHVEHPTAFGMVDGPLRHPAEGSVLVAFHLVPQPIALEEISVEVEGRSGRLARAGFYQRRRVSAAYFMDEDAIRRRRPIRSSDLLRAIPGVRFVEGTAAGFSGFPIMAHTERTAVGDRPPCFPRVYVDGALSEQGGTAWTPTQGFDEIVRANDVVGLEVYRTPAETPAQFGGLTSCGVILLWTRGSR